MQVIDVDLSGSRTLVLTHFVRDGICSTRRSATAR